MVVRVADNGNGAQQSTTAPSVDPNIANKNGKSGGDGKPGADVDPYERPYLALTSVAVYSTEAALRDAIRFQTHCSLAAGLKEATESIEKARRPSIETMTEAFDDLKDMIDATAGLKNAINRAAEGLPPPQKSAEEESVEPKGGN